eukprot:6886096-Prymnesium_polylepis.1
MQGFERRPPQLADAIALQRHLSEPSDTRLAANELCKCSGALVAEAAIVEPQDIQLTTNTRPIIQALG